MKPIANSRRHNGPMSFTNVKLILAREIRDQLRDRRTLFMIVVLPILLYPLLGMSMFQITQFMQEQPTRGVGGRGRELTGSPALFENGGFAEQWLSNRRAE